MSFGNPARKSNSSFLRLDENLSFTCTKTGPRFSSNAVIPRRNSFVRNFLVFKLPECVIHLYILGQNKKSFPAAFCFYLLMAAAPYNLWWVALSSIEL